MARRPLVVSGLNFMDQVRDIAPPPSSGFQKLQTQNNPRERWSRAEVHVEDLGTEAGPAEQGTRAEPAGQEQTEQETSMAEQETTTAGQTEQKTSTVEQKEQETIRLEQTTTVEQTATRT
ncbi:hypothetical protein M9458_057657, partial [Cirrhinus mrigala]